MTDSLREMVEREIEELHKEIELHYCEDWRSLVASTRALAALARRLEKERFGEHVLAQEWQGRAEAVKKDRDDARRLHDLHCTAPVCRPLVKPR